MMPSFLRRRVWNGLGCSASFRSFFDPAIFSIAPGQGVLAAQTRADQTEILSLLHDIEHTPTCIAAEAELAFSHAIGGGCKLPIGCYAKIDGDNITVHGMMGGADAKDGVDDGTAKVIRKSVTGSIDQAIALATALAREFL